MHGYIIFWVNSTDRTRRDLNDKGARDPTYEFDGVAGLPSIRHEKDRTPFCSNDHKEQLFPFWKKCLFSLNKFLFDRKQSFFY